MLCFTKYKALSFMVFFLIAYLPAGCTLAATSDFVVAIDIGHAKKSYGALSARGVPEYEFNRRLALILLEVLREKGYSKSFLINKKGLLAGNDGVKKRTEIAKKKGADLLISIHHDSVKKQFLKEWTYGGKKLYYSDEFKGYSIIISTENAHSSQSMKFARILGDEFLDNGMVPTMYHALDIPGERKHLIDKERGIYDIKFWIVDEAEMPSVLIEAGMIINRNEEKQLASKRYQTLINNSIIKALRKFSQDGKSEPLGSRGN